ncbi:hypothetical protein I7I48_08690 [Histoplasma ohiense]|nr:hypothetical protein I7I48_08690 [Histoplasma ohiense (nom. inval.)]
MPCARSEDSARVCFLSFGLWFSNYVVWFEGERCCGMKLCFGLLPRRCMNLWQLLDNTERERERERESWETKYMNKRSISGHWHVKNPLA